WRSRCPSRPPTDPGGGPPRVSASRGSELLDGGVAQDEGPDAVVAAEVDAGLLALVVDGDDRAEAEGVVGDLVPRRQRRDGTAARRARTGTGRDLRQRRPGPRGPLPLPLDEVRRDLAQEPGRRVDLRCAPRAAHGGAG